MFKKTFKKYSLFCLIIAITLNTADVFADVVIESAAKDFCKCAKPLFDDLNTAINALKSGDMSALATLQKKFGGEGKTKEHTEEIENCMKDLKDKYSKYEDDKEFRAKVEKEIEKQCPKPKMSLNSMN